MWAISTRITAVPLEKRGTRDGWTSTLGKATLEAHGRKSSARDPISVHDVEGRGSRKGREGGRRTIAAKAASPSLSLS